MKTIDELLAQIAKNTGAVPPASVSAEPKTRIKTKESKSTKTVQVPRTLTLSLAKEIIFCIEKGAEKTGVNAVISVVNADGRLIAFEAMDDSYLASVSASQDKAYTAAALRMPTEQALAESRGGAFDGLSNGGGILLMGGGMPLYIDNILVGAVGISGGTKDEDSELARLGVLYLNERIKYTGEAVK